MEDRNFEKKIKSILNQHQANLDHDEIWNEIEPRLKKKRKRRFIIFWFLIGGLAVASLNYLFFMNRSLDVSAGHAVEIEQNSSQQLSNQIYKNDQLSSPNAASTNQPLFDKDQHSGGDVGLNMSLQKTLIQSDQTNKPQTTNEGTRSSNRSKREQSTDNSLNIINKTSQFNVTSTPNSENSMDVNKDLLNNQKATDNSSKTTTLAYETTEQTENKNESINNEINKNITDSKKPTGSESTSSENDEKTVGKKAPAKIEKKWRPRNKWLFEFQTMASPMFAFNSLSATLGEAPQSYVDKRKETESNLEAYAAGVNLRIYNRDRHFIATLGLQYRRINQKFEQVLTHENTAIRTEVVAVVENRAGEIIETETGPVAYTLTTTDTRRVFNHYNFWSLPVGIGYRIDERKFNMSVMAGFDYNLAYTFNGAIIDRQDNFISFKNKENIDRYNELYKKSSGLDFWISAEYARRWNRDFMWTLAPKFQLPLSHLNTSNAGIKQKYYLFGLDIGVVYLLN